MAILDRFFANGETSNKPSITQQIEGKGFEISTCSETCDNCTATFPKSIKYEESEPLWHSTKPYGLHLNIATGKTDWPHDATGTVGTLSNAIANWASQHANMTKLGNIKVSCCSLGGDLLFTDDEYAKEQKGDILILPHFLWLRGVSISQVDEVFTTLLDLLVREPKPATIEELQTAIPQLSIDENRAYVFFCSHRTRDKRCGITAPIMKKELDLVLREKELYRDYGDKTPGGVQAAFVNHVGGHKFVANVIIYLKPNGKNIWLGLCKPNNVRQIVDECILAGGKVWPDKVRLVQKFNPVEW
ncbi:hypothetical protein KGF56_001661 [Candida oxycetoniae]|uniref:Actin patches distal protein 1 n=1 Tax=Candida oxycetoniae TaxID=497107 RepID=A0AAI9SYU3_9ASCO|nr:uncharacterized protein KGF56_001661 [Candida oxycetoniae]KAI3405643.2 hypothetical protein KGF56_001661 [Candida oxycetoniae]